MSGIDWNESNRSTYEQNKREMFDGMRAYHLSEQQHKRDAVNFLKTILTVVVAMNGALFGAALSPNIDVAHFMSLSWVITLIAFTIVCLIVNTANKKIKEDNAVYQKFGSEYTRVCCILDLDKQVKKDGVSIDVKIIDPDKPIGKGDGYKETINIITATGCSIVLIALSLSLVNTFAIG